MDRMKFARLALALAAPLLLASCLLTPGKFASTLHIGKDRSFTFTYVGEVVLLDPGQAFAEGMAQGMAEAAANAPEGGDETGEDQDQDNDEESAAPPPTPAAPAEETAEQVAQRKAIAEALSKEVGYRSVEYLGRNRFRVDYAMSGKLDRSFAYPLNLDAQAIFPWLLVEVRKDGTVRMKAPGFGDPDDNATAPGKPGEPGSERDGTFTFTTDAELVMQNNEEGLAPGPGTRVVWRVTPASKTVPTAVVRFAD